MGDPAPVLSPAEYKALADRCAAAGDFDKAGAAYLECLKLTPQNADAALGLANAARETGKYGIAVRVLETALRHNPHDQRLFAAAEAAHSEADRAARAPQEAAPDARARGAPAAPEFASDSDYVARLQELVAAGRVIIEVDAGRLNNVESPVYVDADTARWAFAVVIGAVAAWVAFDWRAALGVAVLVLVLYRIIGRRRIAGAIERRVHKEALTDIGVWRQLWRHGGVTLRSGAGADARSCAAPEGNWMGFVGEMIDAPASRS